MLTYNATANENNDVLIRPTSATPGAITLDDFGTASLVAGANCPLVSGELRCTGVTSIVLNVGNLGDVADWTAIDLPVTYNASTGNDEGYGGSGNDTFNMAVVSTTSRPTAATTPWSAALKTMTPSWAMAMMS